MKSIKIDIPEAWNRLFPNPDLEVFVEETDRGDWLAVLSRF